MQFKFETEGHLAYSVPTAEETEKMYEQLRSICIAQAERLHPYDKWVRNRALTELDFLRMHGRVRATRRHEPASYGNGLFARQTRHSL